MYFFNQGQALEQYYISIRNTTQLKAHSHAQQFYIRRSTDSFCHGMANAIPPAARGGIGNSCLKGRQGKGFLAQVKTLLVKIVSPLLSLLSRIIKSDMQMELKNKSLFRLMPHSHYQSPLILKNKQMGKKELEFFFQFLQWFLKFSRQNLAFYNRGECQGYITRAARRSFEFIFFLTKPL